MNKVIKGRRYDTETAKEVASTYWGRPGDFEYFEETLFRKSNGEFFLYGQGGALSAYRERTGENEWGGGEKITPLTNRAAQEWAEKNLSGDECESIFGKTEENKVKKTFSISAEAEERLRKMAAFRKMNMSEVLEELIMAEKKI